VKIAHHIDLDSTSFWEVAISEISCSKSPEGENLVLLYCNMISPLLVCDSTVRSVRTFRLYPSATCHYEFQNVQYVPVEQRRFQDIRIDFLTTYGLYIPFQDRTTPTNVVLQIRKNYRW